MNDKKYRLVPLRDLVIPGVIYAACLALGLFFAFRFRDLSFVEQLDQVSAGVFTIAGVLGVMAGFVATATVFLAGAAGTAVEKLRAELGSQLAIRMGTATMSLLLGALVCAVSGIFSNGWGARGVVLGVLAISLGEVCFVAIALTSAFSSAVRPSGRRN